MLLWMLLLWILRRRELLGWNRLVGRLSRRRVGGALPIRLRRLGRGTVRRHGLRRTGSRVRGRHLVRLAVGMGAGADRPARLVRIDRMGHVRGPPWGECVPKRHPHVDS